MLLDINQNCFIEIRNPNRHSWNMEKESLWFSEIEWKKNRERSNLMVDQKFKEINNKKFVRTKNG